jgi:hypothetical protein
MTTATGPAIAWHDGIGWVIQFLGWFAGAFVAYRFGLLAEDRRRDQARRGTLRQVRTLLRDAIKNIGLFSSSCGSIEFAQIEQTHKRFLDRLNERDTAVALSDREYDLLDAFVATLGNAVTYSTGLKAASAALQDPSSGYAVKLFATYSSETLPTLAASLSALGGGDPGLRSDFNRVTESLKRTANLTEEQIQENERAFERYAAELLDDPPAAAHPG